MLVKIQDIIDDKKCFDIIRSKRWENGVRCVQCNSDSICCNGHHKSQPHRQLYKCKDCEKYFDDLTDSIFMGSHLPLKAWITAIYLLGLNLSASQIAKELEVDLTTSQSMCAKLRKGIVQKKKKFIYQRR